MSLQVFEEIGAIPTSIKRVLKVGMPLGRRATHAGQVHGQLPAGGWGLGSRSRTLPFIYEDFSTDLFREMSEVFRLQTVLLELALKGLQVESRLFRGFDQTATSFGHRVHEVSLLGDA